MPVALYNLPVVILTEDYRYMVYFHFNYRYVPFRYLYEINGFGRKEYEYVYAQNSPN